MKSLHLLAALAIVTALAAPVFAENNEQPIDRTAAGVGVTFGNAVFIPFKAISAVWGLGMGGLSFILSGGDTELTRQSWRDVTEGPYVITDEFARQSVGTRPEKEKQ
jgi:hypothetical protein